MVICLERGADLHVAWLIPLPLTVACFIKIHIGLPFWYRLTRVVPDKGPLNGCVRVFANICNYIHIDYWHCRHSVQNRVYVTVVGFVCMSVCPATAAGLLLSAQRAGNAAGAGTQQQQRRRSTALRRQCGQCHVDS